MRDGNIFEEGRGRQRDTFYIVGRTEREKGNGDIKAASSRLTWFLSTYSVGLSRGVEVVIFLKTVAAPEDKIFRDIPLWEPTEGAFARKGNNMCTGRV